MPTVYRGPIIAFAEMIDELIANDRSRSEAVSELRRALSDGALSLLDLHDPAWPNDRLISAALCRARQDHSPHAHAGRARERIRRACRDLRCERHDRVEAGIRYGEVMPCWRVAAALPRKGINFKQLSDDPLRCRGIERKNVAAFG